MMGLYAKLAQVMANIGGVEKSGKNQFFNYKFTTADAAYEAVRTAMANAELAFVASMVDVQQHETGQTDKGGNPVVRTVAKFEYTFVDPETGESKTCLWHGEATDSQDKGVSKASTSALKYFLLKTFIISTEADDPDKSDGYQPKQKQQRPTPQQIRDAGNALDGSKPEPPARAKNAPTASEKPQGDAPEPTAPDLTARTPDELKAWLAARVQDGKGAMQGAIATGQQKNIAIAMSDYFKVETTRRDFLNHMMGVDSYAKLNERQFLTLKKWLNETDPAQIVKEIAAFAAMQQTEQTAEEEFAAI